MLTAAFAGVFVLGCAAWLAKTIQGIDLPKTGWSLSLAQVNDQPPAAGALVKLIDTSVDPEVEIGSAQVQSYNPSSKVLTIKPPALTGAKLMTSTQRVTGGAFSAKVERVVGIPVIDPGYLTLGCASGVILVGALVLFHFVGRRQNSVDFLVAVDDEMKKVNWSTRRIVQNSTIVVIAASFMIAAALFVIDFVLQTFFQFIGVMPS